jgi:hypothetical protein
MIIQLLLILKQSRVYFSFFKIEVDEVISLLKDKDSNASPGISGLPIVILKQGSSSFVEQLKQIFNSCIDQIVCIKEWKVAMVTPLYKSKGDSSDVNNYRGISILSKSKVRFLKNYYQIN